jgi:osmotically-inducible protein OsmY
MIMKTDIQIQKDVMEELKWLPDLNASEIGVTVKNGVVTLSGQVDTFSKKLSAEKAAKKISGVKAIAEDIQIGVSPVYKKTDAEIAADVLDALKWHASVQKEKVKIKVENGFITLDGEVEWQYQRTNIISAIEHLSGVRGVYNLISIKPSITPFDIEDKIVAAFKRNATIDAEKITAEVKGSKVILHGYVHSLEEKDAAVTAAWYAPGVSSVESRLQIEAPELVF